MEQYNQTIDYILTKDSWYNQIIYHYMEASVFITRNEKCLGPESSENGSGAGFIYVYLAFLRARK